MTRRGQRPPLHVTMVAPSVVPLDARDLGTKCDDRRHWNEAFDGVAPHPAIGWTIVAVESAHRPPLHFTARIYVCTERATRLGPDAIPVQPAPPPAPAGPAEPAAAEARA